MDIVAERCPQGHPVISTAILASQLINTWPQNPCCFSSQAYEQNKEKRHRVDWHPKPSHSNPSEKTAHGVSQAVASPLSIPSVKETRGAHI